MIRVSHMASFFFALSLFPFVVPLLIVFSFPIAVSYAVAYVISDMRLHEEFLCIRSFRSMQITVYCSLLLFSCLTTLLYVPLVAHIAPFSYRRGKHYVVGTLKKQLNYLEAGLFHRILPHVTFFFEKRSPASDMLRFEKVFFSLKGNHQDFSFIYADHASIDDAVLSLTQGTLVRYATATWYKGSFEQAHYNLNALMEGTKNQKMAHEPLRATISVKLSTMSELEKEKALYYDAYLEYHKRIMQMIWFFMFPFLAYWLIVRLPFYLLSPLTSMLIGGGLFLASFGCILGSQMIMAARQLPLFLFYSTHSLLFLGFYLFFKKRQDTL